MNEEIIVSINCLVYNHEPYLKQCFEGFVMQKTNFKFEVLIHDDASTDGSVEIIKEYTDKYPDIFKPYFQKENQYSQGNGFVGGKINRERAKGKYIALCEGDDYWIDPLKLQKQVDFLEKHKEYDWVYTDIDIEDEINNIYYHNVYESGVRPIIKDFKTHLISRGYIAPCTWLERNFKEFVNYGDLADPSFAAALEGFANDKIAFMPICTAVYRVNANSVTHKTSKINTILKRDLSILQTQLYFMDKYTERFANIDEKNKIRNKILTENTNKFFALAIAKNDKEWIKICLFTVKECRLYTIKNLLLIILAKASILRKLLILYYKTISHIQL